MGQDERRNLTDGWCREGVSWAEAAQRVDPQEWERIRRDFSIGKSAEEAAALLVYSFTTLIPTSQDDQHGSGAGYDGAVDMLLTDATSGEVQVLEVTTSLDPIYEKSSDALRKFERLIARTYTGQATWALGLERGWQLQRLRELAATVARTLNDLTGIATQGQEIQLHRCVTARMIGSTDPPIVYVESRNAGASSFSPTYLDALSRYLATDPTIRTKLEKLTVEGARLGATRLHLFLGMASSGTRGGLLPASPSYFTWGEFTPPPLLDDLWLDGGAGELYHWTREDGWVFHRT